MNKNLKLLDKFDKKFNIYELICKLSERAHQILNGAPVPQGIKEKDPVQIVMEELLEKGDKNEGLS